MNIVSICLCGIIFASVFSILKILFQMTEYERPCNSAPPILPRGTHNRSHRNNAVGLPANDFNQEPPIPQSVAMHKQILINLNIMECQLAKLEKFLSGKNRPSRIKPRRRVTVKIPTESDSGSNQ